MKEDVFEPYVAAAVVIETVGPTVDGVGADIPLFFNPTPDPVSIAISITHMLKTTTIVIHRIFRECLSVVSFAYGLFHTACGRSLEDFS